MFGGLNINQSLIPLKAYKEEWLNLFSITFIQHIPSHLVTFKMLPMMYIYEINDIIFFIKSPTSHFNINKYIQFFKCMQDLALPRSCWSFFNNLSQITISTYTIYTCGILYLFNCFNRNLLHVIHSLQEFKDNIFYPFHYLCSWARRKQPLIYDKLTWH